MSPKNIRKYTIIFSLLVHLLFLLSYNKFHALALFNKSQFDEMLKEPDREIVFDIERPEVIETPDDAIQNIPTEKTNLVSDKYSIARDRYENKDKELGAPYAQGDFDVKNIERVISAQPFAEESQQAQAASEEMQAENGYSYHPQKFSRQALLGKSAPTPQEARVRYDSDEFNAKDIGGLAFNTYAWDFAPYMLEMKRKVEKNVFPPPAFTHMGLISGQTLLRFKVMPNGELRDLEVLKFEGHKSLMETSVLAIRNSAPFKPLPAEFPENYLEVTATFSYVVHR